MVEERGDRESRGPHSTPYDSSVELFVTEIEKLDLQKLAAG